MYKWYICIGSSEELEVSFLKCSILFALTTALTACATSRSDNLNEKQFSSHQSNATVILTKGFDDARRSKNSYSEKVPFYKICDDAKCETSKQSVRIFPLDMHETKAWEVIPDNTISIIAGLKYPSGYRPWVNASSGHDLLKSSGIKKSKQCVRKLELIPKAGKAYRVTLVEGDNQSCSLSLTEI